MAVSSMVIVLKSAAREAPTPFARLGGEAALAARLAAAGAHVSSKLTNRVTHALLSDAFRAEETSAGLLANLPFIEKARDRGVALVGEAQMAELLGIAAPALAATAAETAAAPAATTAAAPTAPIGGATA